MKSMRVACTSCFFSHTPGYGHTFILPSLFLRFFVLLLHDSICTEQQIFLYILVCVRLYMCLTCVRVSFCVGVQMCVCICVYVCKHLHCSCVYLCMYVCVCAYVCVHACGCGCMRLGVYNARTSMSEGVHVFLYTYKCVYANSADCLNCQISFAEEHYKTVLFLHTGPNHVGGRCGIVSRR